MTSSRLFALGALARGGPMHGYQIRQAAQLDRTELWTDVKPGSLYSVLRRMTEEGLVEVVRTEKVGNPPERTVYAITDRGRQELTALRDSALRTVRLLPDPVDLALQCSADLGDAELTAAVAARRQAVADRLAAFEEQYAAGRPDLVGREPWIFEHCLARLRAELSWHDALLDGLSGAAKHDAVQPDAVATDAVKGEPS
ncbi:PadR family transcriptional regulator [Kitasatospora sp. LaBMicrA B282]|uniref:PadR family transcriptional regulator n=1 Tax=Kitasatospora sp. LaBMicrA B282 TaxID=3420949 RepID=UPI003D0CAFBB